LHAVSQRVSTEFQLLRRPVQIEMVLLKHRFDQLPLEVVHHFVKRLSCTALEQPRIFRKPVSSSKSGRLFVWISSMSPGLARVQSRCATPAHCPASDGHQLVLRRLGETFAPLFDGLAEMFQEVFCKQEHILVSFP